MTDNHNYETPEKGATEWHESLNRNFRYIDRDVEVRDIDAAKTDYRPKSGAKFLATDTEDVYVGDGNQWLRLATSGQNPLFDTVSAKTIVDRDSGNGYSVDELAGGSGGGGIGPPVDAIVTLEDGTPTAYRADGSEIAQNGDAGTLLNSVLTEVAVDGGGTIHVASGTYPAGASIDIPSNITIRGAGRENTVIKMETDEGILSADDPTRNVTIRDLTVDGNYQGGGTGINLRNSVDALIQNCAVKNAGGTDDVPGTTPALRVTRGLRSHIVNCHVESANSVSIEAAITAKDCSIIGCTVTGGERRGDAGFLHGISIEKSDSCNIIGCHVDSSNESSFNSFAPALNANNANRAVVANNTVRGAAGGLYNVNGDCFDNVYIGNTIHNSENPVKIGAGNAGEPHGSLFANNVISDSGEADIGATDSVIRNNIFDNTSLRVREPTTAPTIVGNHFFAHKGKTNIVWVEATDDNSPVLFANNHSQINSTTEYSTVIHDFAPKYGIMIGNSFGTVSAKATVRMTGDRWLVTGNYFRGPEGENGPSLSMCGGRVENNVFEGTNKIELHDSATAANTPVVEGNTYFSQKPTLKGSPADFTIGEPRAATFTGDGTQGRFIQTYSNPEHVILENGSGTKYDVHAQFGPGFEYNSPSGELSISDGGFTIGDNGSGADPNISTETYTFYVRG